jgi:hypothetical protein
MSKVEITVQEHQLMLLYQILLMIYIGVPISAEYHPLPLGLNTLAYTRS